MPHGRMMHRNTCFFLCLVIILLLYQSAHAQNINITRISDPVIVDGRLDEQVWGDAGSITGFTQFEPKYGEQASFGTVVKILYDDRMVYFGIECKDPDIASLSRKITRRDGEVWEDDAIALVIDTFNDDNNAYFLIVNALGTQQDERWADNGRTRDTKWDAKWHSAGAVNPDGWTAEVALPFEVVKFDRNTQEWGLNVIRYIPRNLEMSHWIPGLAEWFRIAEIGTITGLDLTSVVTKNYTFIPYAQSAFTKGEKTTGDVGLDVRYSLSSNMGIDLTFNPDFATIEADVEQVNLTRFELSYPEKRPFFLEGGENYSTRIKQFYSRRIGEIPWGVKVNGKIGDWKINALSTQSDSSAVRKSASGDNAYYTVFRVNREINNSSNIGVIGANRTYNGENKGSAGLVGTLFFSRYLGMTTQFIKSYGDYTKGSWTYFVRPSYDSKTGHFHVRYTHVGENVRENMNEVGYIRDDDRREVDSNIRKQFWINRHGFQDIKPSVNYNRYWSQTGVLRSWEIRNSLAINFRKNWSLSLNNNEEFKRYEKDFRNSLNETSVKYDSKTGRSVSVKYGKGINYDRDLEKFGGTVSLKIMEGWNAAYNLTRIWFRPDTGNSSSWIHYVRTTYYVNKDMYFKMFYQSKYDLTGSFSDPRFDLNRETVQFVYVWRFLPPFGSLQLAYQQGPSNIAETRGKYKTLFTKLSWVF
ncbi:DUF5916 domain-containing protein [candidate division KSB1 bacterium]